MIKKVCKLPDKGILNKEYLKLLNKKFKLKKHWIIQKEKPSIKDNPFILT